MAITSGLVALALWACGPNRFTGNAPENPNPPEQKNSEQNPSPQEVNEGPQAPGPQAPAIDPRRSVALQITGVQPESWWNNCLKVELGGKSFDIACTKDTNVTGKVVRIPIPDGITCPSLKLRLVTFKNVGSTCAEKASAGQTCNGPYETSPSFVRAFEKADERVHFVVTEASQAGGGKLMRVHFEDQPKESIADAKRDPVLASRLGIDFNDAIFDIKTLELPFEIQGAAGTKCP